MRRNLPLILTLTVIAAIGIFYFLIDPGATEWVPRCPLHSLTGLDCPGCGSQRMLHSLLHGDLTGAWKANPFLLLSLPLIVALLILEILYRRDPQRYSHLYRRAYGPLSAPLAAVAVIAWGIGRNLHFFFN